ncbi:hypothetical protein [Okeania sp. SIO1I7]|uniref:hypothetical protein n=1 Tax=Okeania sp. SIO1I7 TaxID=2607772 RepID=UPI0013F6A8E8|nr:hypothetical protein [Okeania sp. SIO1I7]NET26145.1 hypothetical protein [Okeania sp. SIO1I7]
MVFISVDHDRCEWLFALGFSYEDVVHPYELYGPSVLVGECKTLAQQWVQAKINLGDRIANINGILRYE